MGDETDYGVGWERWAGGAGEVGGVGLTYGGGLKTLGCESFGCGMDVAVAVLEGGGGDWAHAACGGGGEEQGAC